MNDMIEEFAKLTTQTKKEKPNCSDVIRCIFNLNQTDLMVLKTLPEQKSKTIQQLSKTLNKDRSTIHRSLEKLIACNLCYKERHGGTNRGFIDYYYRLTTNQILKIVQQNIDTCYQEIKKILNKFEDTNTTLFTKN